MRRTGTAELPLHYGSCPRWLFRRMSRLARVIAEIVVYEFGPEQLVRKLSDPFFFQAFGCVLGFDWHSSGLTTTLCGALKEGLKGTEEDLGIFVAGGKGATSRKTPSEIEAFGHLLTKDPRDLIYASRMAAKVDSAALQDGYQLYHHCFVFTREGFWAVVQQGLNEETRYARRYHWLGEEVQSFVCEPHQAICSDARGEVLNMVAQESHRARSTTALLAQERPDRLISQLKRLQGLKLPPRHQVLLQDIHPDRLNKIFLKTYEQQPQDFESLLTIGGVGRKTIRALSLVSELVYGVSASFRDPARYSFAHGGKDGYPYPVDRTNYDQNIQILETAISKARMGNRDKLEAIKRLRLVQ
ncbi:MAG: DUF763 domain-containing protein [Candidatus Latescibacterota bacterium]|nr:MAG: DUF763 domain-containing protein [Candidatus Latescibacterota bacterium]RKY71229.1 MAG: DUF763 domain-containing protein [Candidatus Latescibacterota bacterium]